MLENKKNEEFEQLIIKSMGYAGFEVPAQQSSSTPPPAAQATSDASIVGGHGQGGGSVLAYSNLSDDQRKLYDDLKVAIEGGSYGFGIFSDRL